MVKINCVSTVRAGMSDTSEREAEFRRERRAAKNRLAKISVRDISVVDVSENGVQLKADDLRILAIIVEEETQLDPLLGLEVEGVSYRSISKLMDIENKGSVTYRVDKLVEAKLVDRQDVESLPVETRGANPRRLVATSGGRRLVDELELIPILKRDRDFEKEFDLLVQDYLDLRQELIQTVGRQLLIVQELLQADERLDEFQFEFEKDFISMGEGAVSELEPSFSLGRNDKPWKLLGEMDADERELMMQKLLDESSEEGKSETS